MKVATFVSLVVGALSATAVVHAAYADDDPWEVRLRGVYLDPANKSDAIPGLAPKDSIHINHKLLPDLDFEYRFTPNWSTELILTYPQKQTVTVGNTPIGTFNHLPPILTAKYNFLPNSDFQPYVGVGVNITLITDVHLAVPNVGKLTLNRSSVGPAAQAGFDYKIADHWFLNADVKWALLGSNVDLQGVGPVTRVHINPLLFGVGIGYRFGGGGSAAAPVAAAAVPTASPPPPPPPAEAAPAPPPPPVAVVPPAAPEVILKGVNFENDSAKLTATSTSVLDGVVASLQQHPGAAEVHGYTDSKGKAAHNLALSQHRAEAVVRYLVAHGIPASSLEARGYGEDSPVASNDTVAGRAENRRVTIQFAQPASR